MDGIAQLLIVLVGARVMGRLVVRLHQPASVGEIAAGVVLALLATGFLSSVPWVAGLSDSPMVYYGGQAGIFFLLLFAGVEMRPDEIVGHSWQAVAVALGGMILPLCLGGGLAWIVLPDSDLRAAQALVVGAGLAISAIPVAAKIFLEFDLLHEPVGEIVIAAAVIDDVLGLMLLAIVTGMVANGAPPGNADILIKFGKIIGFFVVAGLAGVHVLPRLWRFLHDIDRPGVCLGGLLAVALAFGLIADALGMHVVLGPFMAGLFFEPARIGAAAYERVRHTLDALTSGVLGPIFFASIGLGIDLGAMIEVPAFLAALIAIAILGKVAGAGLPAYWSGLERRQAFAVGVGMSGRGAVELIVASVALQAGVFHHPGGPHPILDNLFSALVLTAVVTTALMPMMLRPLCRPR
jgi:Kef-type K+ transport system membrane component KefB